MWLSHSVGKQLPWAEKQGVPTVYWTDCVPPSTPQCILWSNITSFNLSYCLLAFLTFIYCLCICVGRHMPKYACGGHRKACGFSPSIIWFWGTKLRSLVLAAGTTAHGAISLAASFLLIILCLTFLWKQIFHVNTRHSRASYMRMIFQNFSRRQWQQSEL